MHWPRYSPIRIHLLIYLGYSALIRQWRYRRWRTIMGGSSCHRWCVFSRFQSQHMLLSYSSAVTEDYVSVSYPFVLARSFHILLPPRSFVDRFSTLSTILHTWTSTKMTSSITKDVQQWTHAYQRSKIQWNNRAPVNEFQTPDVWFRHIYMYIFGP